MSDFDQYQDLQVVMRRLLTQFSVAALDQPEYQAAWRASEKIKNRNGGMPPKDVAAVCDRRNPGAGADTAPLQEEPEAVFVGKEAV